MKTWEMERGWWSELHNKAFALVIGKWVVTIWARHEDNRDTYVRLVLYFSFFHWDVICGWHSCKEVVISSHILALVTRSADVHTVLAPIYGGSRESSLSRPRHGEWAENRLYLSKVCSSACVVTCSCEFCLCGGFSLWSHVLSHWVCVVPSALKR